MTKEGRPAYPLTLREGWFGRIFAGLYLVVAVGLALLSLVMIWDVLRGRANLWALVAILAFGAIAWFALVAFCEAALGSVTLTSDAFEANSPLGRRRLHRSEIAGYRIIRRSRLPDRLRIEPRDPGEKALEVNLVDQEAVERWFGAPSLDEQDAATSRQAMLDDPAFGATAPERAQSMRIWRYVAAALNLVGVAITAWLAFAPEPRPLLAVLTIGAPLVAFALLAGVGRRFKAMGPTSDARATLIALFLAGGAMGLRDAVFEEPLLNGLQPFAPALAIGAAGLAALWFLDRVAFSRQGGWWIVGLLLLFWGWGAMIEVDRLADTGPGRVFTTTVVDKQFSRGRASHWYVTLGPWGPSRGPTRIDQRDLYDKVTLGQQVCVALHPGALRMPWREVIPCQDADTAKA